MIIEKPIYYIMWKERPIQFMTSEHTPTDYFDEAYQYSSRQEADEVIKMYDKNDELEILSGHIEVQI